MKRLLAVMAAACTLLSMTPPSVHSQVPRAGGAIDYAPSRMCGGCHDEIVDQQVQSEHETSFTNPLFQAQYFQEVLPNAANDPALIEEAQLCIACHAPIAYKKTRGHVTRPDQVDPSTSGVTCDFCHTISGYLGKIPQNGNFISEPSEMKLGPFRHKSTWHHVYAELQTKSEVCAICHNAVNHHGLEIKSTYTEWKGSRYAREGIQCQDCHMTVYGFLTGGKATYGSGQAAHMILGTAPDRSRLYTHRFPGAHSKTQVKGAITLDIDTGRTSASPGDEIAVRVLIDNERTGHKMPSGSADLRQLWLDLQADIGGKRISIPAGPARRTDAHDVVGGGSFDQLLLGQDIPKGSRIYRAIFVDETGKPTLSSYDAVEVVFDNRLDAGEIREERYHLTVPADARGTLRLQASLNYLPYPSSFSRRLGLGMAESVEVASTQKSLSIRRGP
ncbi:MAG TPA: multiheme c-type cytochrome [Candidatus Methylomirabilis sp.]|nr:multiheme c-type cytochrome [Candidatus Methylomirabilis sp.]